MLLMHALGRKLKVTRQVTATAIVFFHIAKAVHKLFLNLSELLAAFHAEVGEVTAELLELYRQTSRLAENDELAPGATAKLSGHWRA